MIGISVEVKNKTTYNRNQKGFDNRVKKKWLGTHGIKSP